MTKIECSGCGEMIELTWNSVTLPFICNECLAASVKRDAMAPCQKSCGDKGADATELSVHDQADIALGCANASIEATTELIADLEAQVVRANELVADYEVQYNEAVGIVARLSAEKSVLTERNTWQKNQLELLTTKIIDLRNSQRNADYQYQKDGLKIADLMKELNHRDEVFLVLADEFKKSQSRNFDLGKENKVLDETNEQQYREWRNLDEIKTRGFLARIFKKS